MYYTSFAFSQGNILLIGDKEGLATIKFYRKAQDRDNTLLGFKALTAELEKRDTYFRKEQALFDRYFQGEKEDFQAIRLNFLLGTPYQHRVWKEARKIPWGRVESYKSLAERLGHKGYRSVGQALNRNPFLIVVPCHRIISADGGMGGFGAGLELKRWLLKLES